MVTDILLEMSFWVDCATQCLEVIKKLILHKMFVLFLSQLYCDT